MAIRLLVGLGNPGPEYQQTRHNAGQWLLAALAARHGCELVTEKRFYGACGRISIGGRELRLLAPGTFMNRSGQAVAAMANFFKIAPREILVAHDELDLPAGVARLKQGGGHGGHNGLRDTISALGNNADFLRLRLGIGHPGSSALVTAYVLSRAPEPERAALLGAIDASLDALPDIVTGDIARAMNELHRYKANAV
jgi:PTH1 family peptidyl-tRNA hydrolase